MQLLRGEDTGGMEIEPRRTARAILGALLAVGAFEQIAQVLLVREFFVVFKGNEVSFGAVFAFWMFWTAAGSWVFGLFANKIKKPVIWLCILNIFLCACLAAEIYLTRVSRSFFSVPSGAYLSIFSMALFTFVLLAGVCFTGGALFVVGARLYASLAVEGTLGVPARAYIADSLGCLAGGLIVTFVLVTLFDPFTAAFLCSAALMAVTSWLALRASGRKLCLAALLASFAFLVMAFAGSRVDDAANTAQWRAYNESYKLEETRNSKYGNIAVLSYREQYSLFGNGELYFTMPDETAPREAASLYALQHEKPENVLVIGGGISGLLAWLLEYGVGSIDYVELDPAVIETARKYLASGDARAIADPRVSLHHVDGRLFVSQTQRKYDLVICGLPDPSTASLNRFYTLEFFREANRILTQKGVFITGVCASGFWEEEMLNRNCSIYATLIEAFPKVAVSPCGGFFAGGEQSEITLDPDTLVEKYRARNIEILGFIPEIFHVMLEPDSVEAANEKLSKLAADGLEGRPMINRDSFPVSYYYNLVIWNRHSDTSSGKAFDWMIKVRTWWVVPVIILLFLPSLMLGIPASFRRQRIRERYSVLLLMAAAGFLGMVIEIALLYLFQNAYGYVYSMIGLLTAMFMFGLASGAAISSKTADRFGLTGSTIISGLAALLFCGLVAGLASIPFVLSGHFALWLFLVLNLLGGILVGAMFGLMSSAAHALKWSPERSAGFLYGADLAGACLGALTAGSLLIPVLGIQSTCLVIAFIFGAALASFTVACRKT